MRFKRILPVQLFGLLFLAGAFAATDPTPIENTELSDAGNLHRALLLVDRCRQVRQ
jgi:hypothetical protein